MEVYTYEQGIKPIETKRSETKRLRLHCLFVLTVTCRRYASAEKRCHWDNYRKTYACPPRAWSSHQSPPTATATAPPASFQGFGFVHIPKTGGTAIRDVLEAPSLRRACPGLHFYRNHERTERQWQRRGFHSILVLRDPVDRFRSAFDYAAFGSDKYSNRDWRLGRHFGNASGFAASLRNTKYDDLLSSSSSSSSSLSSSRDSGAVAWNVIKHREHGVQFRPAVRWVDGDAKRRTVVCYNGQQQLHKQQQQQILTGNRSSPDLAGAIAAIVARGRPPQYSRTPSPPVDGMAEESSKEGSGWVCNIRTKPRNVSSKRSAPLDREGAAWVKNYYKEDVALFEKYCSTTAEK